MAYGPIISNNDPLRTLSVTGSPYQLPAAYEQLLPNALDDVCIEFSRATGIDKVYGFDAIDNMIVNVLYTRIGERDFEPEFGSNVLDLLQEPNDNLNYSFIEVEIFERVRRWVPYIDLVLSGIIIQPIPVHQAFAVAFVYNERVTGIQHTFTAFLSRRGRSLLS